MHPRRGQSPPTPIWLRPSYVAVLVCRRRSSCIPASACADYCRSSGLLSKAWGSRRKLSHALAGLTTVTPWTPRTFLGTSLKNHMLQSVSMVPDSRCKPALDAFMASGAGVHGDTLWRHYFPGGVAAESPAARCLLPLAPLHTGGCLPPVWLPPSMDPVMLLVEFLVVTTCAYVLSRNGLSCSA